MRFEQFTETTFLATAAAWQEDAERGLAFQPDVEQSISWAKEHLKLTGNEMAYGVFGQDSDKAVGICELAITRLGHNNVWVKVLRLRLRPEIEEQIFLNIPDAVQTAVNAYITAVIGVFEVKDLHKASTIKVYGRTKEQVGFLTLLAASLNARQDTISYRASIEGRWLVLNWSQK